MKITKADILFLLFVLALFVPFFASKSLYSFYETTNQQHGMVLSFIKFAILATMGEVIALRIKTAKYNKPGFGILPRAIVWGFLGLTIKMAFVIFATGTPAFLSYMGIEGAGAALKGPMGIDRILVAFSISVAMNVIYAPVMMTLHKITDIHIVAKGGTIAGLFSPINIRKIFNELDWDTQWNFVFKKTIPFFWIPAHTITFLLPADLQVLFAALLGIALGIILSLASLKKQG